MNINDFAVQIEFTVGELNGFVNLLNRPYQATVADCVYFMNLLQTQAEPQIVKAQQSLDAVQKTQEEKNG